MVFDIIDCGGGTIIAGIVGTIRVEWEAAANAARLTKAQRDAMWERQILNPFIFQDALT